MYTTHRHRHTTTELVPYEVLLTAPHVTHLCRGDLLIVSRRLLLLFSAAEVEYGVIAAIEVLWSQPVGPLDQGPHVWDTPQLSTTANQRTHRVA